MNLLPKEHGAYGQMAFPIVTALAITGPAAPAVMIAIATVAAFLAHEPAAVVLGFRGSRAKRNLRPLAARLLAVWMMMAATAGVLALLATSVEVWWTLLVPLGPAAVLSVATVRGQEKSGYGEVASALAFSSVPIPMVVTTGRSITTALEIAIPFAVLFVTATLAVRVVILRVRGGGNLEATATTRGAAYALVGTATAALLWSVTATVLPLSVFVAAAPGLVMAAAIAAHPPAPSRLRSLGWTLVAVSVFTAITTITAARL